MSATEKNIIKKVTENMSKHKGWVVLNTMSAITSYNDSRNEGKGRIYSAASAGGQFLFYELLGKAVIPFSLAPVVSSLAVPMIEQVDQMSRQMNNVTKNVPFMNNRFYDTRQGYTMRQQGMALAKNSRYQLEQTLMGNEAQYLKR